MTFISVKSGLFVTDEPIYRSWLSTDGTMSADSDSLVPSQAAVVTYVTGAISSGLVGVVDDRGQYNPNTTNLWPVTGGRGIGGLPIKGDMWEASASGTMNGTSIEIGWWFRALVNTPGQTASNWAISITVQTYQDIVNALGYTPYNATNPSGYISTINGITAGGDLSGTYPNPTVAKINGNTIPANTSGFLNNNGTGALTWSAVTGFLPVNNPAYTGSLTTGALGYTDTGILAALQSSTNSYNQLIIENTNSGAAASSDIVVNNNLSTATTYYGDFGMNGSGFTGSGSLNIANGVYLTSTTADLILGTTTANAIHFVTNGATTDAASISATGVFTIANLVPNVTTVTNSATPTYVIVNRGIYTFTGLNVAITNMSTNMTGTLVDGMIIEFRFTDNGTPRALAWGSAFASTTDWTLPTTTIASKCLSVFVQCNANNSNLLECKGIING